MKWGKAALFKDSKEIDVYWLKGLSIKIFRYSVFKGEGC